MMVVMESFLNRQENAGKTCFPSHNGKTDGIITNFTLYKFSTIPSASHMVHCYFFKKKISRNMCAEKAAIGAEREKPA